jgi:hypothetical protein
VQISQAGTVLLPGGPEKREKRADVMLIEQHDKSLSSVRRETMALTHRKRDAIDFCGTI